MSNRRNTSESGNVTSHIGVLDIFGFEVALENSLEQLCVNYTNEALQQQFSAGCCKDQIMLYKREKIQYETEFVDNLDVVHLLSASLFRIMDDQMRIPDATDKRLAAAFYKNLLNNQNAALGSSVFSASGTQQRDLRFSIYHFAGAVEHTVTGFIEKNANDVPTDVNQMLQNSYNSICSSLELPASSVDKTSRAKHKTESVVLQFKTQLTSLMSYVNAATPFYVRCIEPVEYNAATFVGRDFAARFDDQRVAEQLVSSGAIEAIRIARSGFAVVLSIRNFYNTFRFVGDIFVKNAANKFTEF